MLNLRHSNHEQKQDLKYIPQIVVGDTDSAQANVRTLESLK